MDAAIDLATLRRCYARQVVAAAGALGDEPLERAFAAVARERFIPAGRWQLFTVDGGVVRDLPPEPVLLYQNALVALAAERGVNNGSPVLHARWLAAVAVRPGDRVAHIGAGTGYYSAILAELAGPGGHVEAVEIDPSLAAIARAALAGDARVEVVVDDGAGRPWGEVDVAYVNAAVSRPAASWLDNLADGGRLVFPLGVPLRPGDRHAGAGMALLITRHGTTFAARSLGPAYFVLAEGCLADDADRAGLAEAFRRGGEERIVRLHWREPPAASSWYVGTDWSLATDP